MASPIPDIPELFISSSAPAFNWLEAGRWARAMQSYDDAAAAQCFVERVVHCKCKEDKRHEFLWFEISSPTGSYRATVFVDRRVDVTQGVKQKAAVMSPSPSQTISNSEIPLANDLVWVAAKGGDSETSLNNQFDNQHARMDAHTQAEDMRDAGATKNMMSRALSMTYRPPSALSVALSKIVSHQDKPIFLSTTTILAMTWDA
ncbi:hypothetical protein M405DRAFT_859205 [Rhizopogon salebrosus TDB-379]|nr:hypothetical protein M405DRAFT_859205 [Rhizopogon salebrosus TDB-379]